MSCFKQECRNVRDTNLPLPGSVPPLPSVTLSIHFPSPAEMPLKLSVLPAPKLLPIRKTFRIGADNDKPLTHWQNQVLIFDFSVPNVKVNV